MDIKDVKTMQHHYETYAVLYYDGSVGFCSMREIIVQGYKKKSNKHVLAIKKIDGMITPGEGKDE